MRRYESRDARFSARALLTYASASLPETLSVVAATNDAPAEILLYDEIGMWGTSATDFAQALSRAGAGPLTLRINSPGGDVFDGYAIYNMLRARKASVNVVVDGLAASAASFIAMAGTSITMGEPAMLMIHNCWGMCIGDRNDMLDMAATQEKIDGQIAAIYASKSGKSAEDMAAMMNAETWYTSDEAKSAGLCDVVATDQKPAALAASVVVKPKAAATVQLRAAYSPDDDGDDDAADAIGLIQSAIGRLTDAIEALNGTEPMGEEPSNSNSETVIAANDDAVKVIKDASLRRLRLAEAEAA